jgi:multicomponent Na+:H+ antiporter subunit B
VCAAGFAALFGWGLMGLPDFGHYRGPYGDIINALTVSERHITDAVTAVTVDFRGFDTLGEENILFISVMGVALLLRKQKGEKGGPEEDKAAGRKVPRASDAVRALSVALVGPTALFGIYIVVHGQVSPGGGFQGGVILATAPLLVYLAGYFSKLRRIAPHWALEAAEAVGVGGYAVLGLIGYFEGAGYLTNVLPLGKPGELVSGGLAPFINIAIGLAVGAGFLLLLITFLAETLNQKDAL